MQPLIGKVIFQKSFIVIEVFNYLWRSRNARTHLAATLQSGSHAFDS